MEKRNRKVGWRLTDDNKKTIERLAKERKCSENDIINAIIQQKAGDPLNYYKQRLKKLYIEVYKTEDKLKTLRSEKLVKKDKNRNLEGVGDY